MIFIFDIVKLVMSFLVAAIHINPLVDISKTANFYLVECLGRIAVPIFFSIAGYLLYRKILKDQSNCYNIVKKYLLRIFSIYLIWSIIYYIPYSGGIVSFEKIKIFIFNFIFKGVFSQLWYMQSLIIGVILSTFSSKLIGIKKTLIISFFFYIVALLIVPYFPYISKTFAIPDMVLKLIPTGGYKIGRNGLFFGMFFVTLGGFLVEKQYLLLKNNKYIYVFIFILSIVLLFVESNIIKYCEGNYYGLQLSLVPLTFSAMMLLLMYNEKTNIKLNTQNIRILSFLIYLVHEWVNYFYKNIFQTRFNNLFINNSLIKYIIIMIITVVISYMIIYLSKKEKFKFLKKLY